MTKIIYIESCAECPYRKATYCDKLRFQWGWNADKILIDMHGIHSECPLNDQPITTDDFIWESRNEEE